MVHTVIHLTVVDHPFGIIGIPHFRLLVDDLGRTGLAIFLHAFLQLFPNCIFDRTVVRENFPVMLVIGNGFVPFGDGFFDVHLLQILQLHLADDTSLQFREPECFPKTSNAFFVVLRITDDFDGLIHGITCSQYRRQCLIDRTVFGRLQHQLMIIPALLIVPLRDPAQQNLSGCADHRTVVDHQIRFESDGLAQGSRLVELLHQDIRIISTDILHNDLNATGTVVGNDLQIQNFRECLICVPFLFLDFDQLVTNL